MNKLHPFLCVLLLTVAPARAADPDPTPIPGVGPAGVVTKLHTGFKFTEGPAADGDGNLYFTDIPNNRVHKVDADGKLSTVLEQSEGCNGLMLDARGRLVACQGTAKRLVAIDPGTKKVTVLADACDGKPLGTPNDLVIDRTGGVYFTAPDLSSVFYLPPAGKALLVLDGLPRPNGVLLSPDEKTLYVLPSGSADVLSHPIERPGAVGKAKVLCKLEQNPKQPNRLGGDGLTVDSRGNLYLTKPSLKAIQVVGPDGKTLGLIRLPEDPSNCTFGGKGMKTLYVTAQSSLYAVKMDATGHRFGATRSEEPLPEAWEIGRAHV